MRSCLSRERQMQIWVRESDRNGLNRERMDRIWKK